jgi:hypothetical protein
MSKRAPFIALYTDVLKDEALHMLADTAGYNRFEALGRISALWMWCRDRGLEDAPADSDYYAVSEAVVRRLLGPAGVDGILGGGCDELALGIRFRDGLIQLRGTQHDVARLRELSRTRQAGGRARAGGERDGMGRFGTPPHEEPVSQPTSIQHDSACDSSRTPAGLQLHPPDLQRPDPEEERERGAASPLHLASSGSKASGKRRSKPRREPERFPIPEGWAPRQHEREKARGLGLDADREATRFANNALSKGHTYADWNAAFRMWLDNAPEFNARAGPGSSTSRPPDAIRPTTLLT